MLLSRSFSFLQNAECDELQVRQREVLNVHSGVRVLRYYIFQKFDRRQMFQNDFNTIQAEMSWKKHSE